MSQHRSSFGGEPSNTSTASGTESLPAYSQDISTPSFAEAFESEVNHQLEKGLPEVSYYGPGEETEAILAPGDGLPGYAPESVLQRGLQIPTRSRTVTSGFKYPQVLSQANVSEEDWSAFTSEIKQIAKMDARQWSTTIGKGVGTFAAGGLLVGFLGAVPAAMVARKVHERTEAKNLSSALSDPGSELQTVIERWNTSFFRPKGLIVRVDLPGEYEDMSAMDVSTSLTYRQERMRGKGKSPTPKHIEAAEKAEKHVRHEAAHRSRIVILPLNDALAAEASSASRAESTASSFTTAMPDLAYEQRTGMKDYFPNEPKP